MTTHETPFAHAFSQCLRIKAPDRQADKVTDSHALWHATEKTPGMLITAEAEKNQFHRDTATLVKLGKLGMQPIFDFMDIRFAEAWTEQHTKLLARTFPSTLAFCAAANTLLQAVEGDDNLLRLAPTERQTAPTDEQMTHDLVRRQISISTDPHQLQHDMMRGIAALAMPGDIAERCYDGARLAEYDSLERSILAPMIENYLTPDFAARMLDESGVTVHDGSVRRMWEHFSAWGGPRERRFGHDILLSLSQNQIRRMNRVAAQIPKATYK